jgi:hypothetical protein
MCLRQAVKTGCLILVFIGALAGAVVPLVSFSGTYDYWFQVHSNQKTFNLGDFMGLISWLMFGLQVFLLSIPIAITDIASALKQKKRLGVVLKIVIAILVVGLSFCCSPLVLFQCSVHICDV